MFKIFSILFSCILISLIVCQEYLTDEHDFSGNGNGNGFVDVDVQKHGLNGKHVGVHVPSFYKMNLDKDWHRTGLGINVLEGLVKVRVKKDPLGLMKPKVHVAVGGIPFWNQ